MAFHLTTARFLSEVSSLSTPRRALIISSSCLSDIPFLLLTHPSLKTLFRTLAFNPSHDVLHGTGRVSGIVESGSPKAGNIDV